jgi:hypothetical protein
MVRGIEKFKEFFTGYEDNYIVTGGTACDILEEKAGQQPRATKDIDIILIVEALSADFVKRFWEFIKAGQYNPCQQGEGNGKHQYFRFFNPKEDVFPNQIELFSRKPDILQIPEDIKLIHLPVDEDLSSLSAILMNDEYYSFTIEHSTIEDNVHRADIESLIILKAKAFMDLSERKAKGEKIDEKNIRKHKNDIFRLATMLAETDEFMLPDAIFWDFAVFCETVKDSLPEDSFFTKTIGIKGITSKDVFDRLCKSFNIKWESENTVRL